ncbi:MAG: coenzyme F420-0:L-glutamate ligase [Chloroflexi bacterium]|nr:coenzyme F420-0:L-glutamate ligase [Chloroflexota bacterium]
MYFILIILALIAVLAGIFILTLKLWGRHVGDFKLEIRPDESPVKWYRFSPDTIIFTIPFTFESKSPRQQVMIIDLFARVRPECDLPPGKIFLAFPSSPEGPRPDGYWQAFIIKPGKSAKVNMELLFTSNEAVPDDFLEDFPPLKLDIYTKAYARRLLRYNLHTFRPEWKSAVQTKDAPPYLEGTKRDKSGTCPRGVTLVRTPLLLPGDGLVEIAEKYASSLAKKGDVFCIAESALAIIQGRIIYCEDVHPGFWAKLISPLFSRDSSISSPYGAEMGIREVGLPRMITAVIIGSLTKLFGRKGDFYRIAGKAVTTIDDCTGTIPPFDKYVVLGPADLEKTLTNFKKETGLDAAVIDANDLGKVDVIKSTRPELNEIICKALKQNPQGNANQRTPIILVSPGEFAGSGGEK